MKMTFAGLLELIPEKPLDVNLITQLASWAFDSLREQYDFVIRLDALIEASGYALSQPDDKDGEVMRIDYLYLKDYEGFEVWVYHDFKVELRAFGY
jgi:hypothetical protein